MLCGPGREVSGTDEITLGTLLGGLWIGRIMWITSSSGKIHPTRALSHSRDPHHPAYDLENASMSFPLAQAC